MFSSEAKSINNSIELNRIVKIKGEYFFVKKYLYLADIYSIEGAVYGNEKNYADRTRCTLIIFNDGVKMRFKEKYKAVVETYKYYQNWLQELDKKDDEKDDEKD